MKNFLLKNIATAFFPKCSLFEIFELQLPKRQLNKQQINDKILKEVDFVALAPSYDKDFACQKCRVGKKDKVCQKTGVVVFKISLRKGIITDVSFFQWRKLERSTKVSRSAFPWCCFTT